MYFYFSPYLDKLVCNTVPVPIGYNGYRRLLGVSFVYYCIFDIPDVYGLLKKDVRVKIRDVYLLTRESVRSFIGIFYLW